MGFYVSPQSTSVNLTCIKNPWIPSDNTQAARFINEIVLEERQMKLKVEML